ncbi:hypothetical protein [Phenylobacterium sp.]|uniref:hypothetical protein n=1 Tax=Phenylobacterium sp. TaxID=1871053 RepID=UPI0027360F74|nr:hypothetical protein [Phenylobacterium sp.]MDP3853711.1 hypothetical protein [Phenylobacterium sp.]
MAADAAIFVSKRLQRAAFALLCILAAHMVLAMARGEPEPGEKRTAGVQLRL